MSVLLDLRSVIDTFTRSGGLSITRRTAGAITNGFAAAPSETTVQYDFAVVTHAESRDLEKFEEGDRFDSALKILTKTALQCEDLPDRFTWNSNLYEVQSCEWWEQGQYYKSIAFEVKES